MIVAVDVDYGVDAVTTAAVGFTDWLAETSALELVNRVDGPPADYEPGRFFERELPHLLAILALVTEPVELVIIDGYVRLGPDRPGLGTHLHAARGLPIVGVAKTRFAGTDAIAITRGTSASPLYVTTIGIDEPTAAAHVVAMAGPYRIPTLLKRADTLARGR